VTSDELAALASRAQVSGEEATVLPRLAKAAAKHHDPRLYQWTALLHRSLDQHGEAIGAFEAAARLAPTDALIAHGLARTVMEAGRDARPAYDRACTLAPTDGDLLVGQSAARLAQGEGQRAADDLTQILAANPLWTAGHAHLAQLQALIGRPDRATDSIDRALATHPAEPSLWTALFDLAIRREAYFELEELIRCAPLSPAGTAPFAAIAAAETGQFDEATRLFATLPPTDLPIRRIRHALRSDNAAHALALIDAELAGLARADVWPYAFLAWRVASDPRFAWLATNAVRVIDLADRLSLTDLEAKLRSLHAVSGQFLDQSVRGGTQTDGPLLSRLEPELRETRAIIVEAVEQYRAELPIPHPSQPKIGHPLLGQRRDRRIRFAGSWSVRLPSQGRHAAHVHPQGWISSALYVSLPDTLPGNDGWLELGAPPSDLGLDLPPTQSIEPRPGRLVLFPSWLWHSTRAFADGERLTIAFDVAPPR
jgi:tetratricopeptide (TPR) repeat protein